MWTKHIILGLVAACPAHGYAIRAALQERLGDFWTPTNAQAYRILTLLEDEGLVAGRDERIGRRPTRTVYHVTQAGRDVLRRWLTEPPAPAPLLRDDCCVRLLFADLLQEEHGEDGPTWFLKQQNRVHTEHLAQLVDGRDAAPHDPNGGGLRQLVFDAAILHAEADLAVLERYRVALHRAAEQDRKERKPACQAAGEPENGGRRRERAASRLS